MDEEREHGQSPNFDILNWWKLISTKFPILGNIAREVLAMSTSTVPFESTLGTRGWVLDQYLNYLSPKIVEAIVCLEDWLKGSPTTFPSKEDLEEIEKIEQGDIK